MFNIECKERMIINEVELVVASFKTLSWIESTSSHGVATQKYHHWHLHCNEVLRSHIQKLVKKKWEIRKPHGLTWRKLETVWSDVQRIREWLLASPSRSLHRLSWEAWLPYTRCHRAAMKVNLNPYYMSFGLKVASSGQGKICAWF
jgi:hypothetical protein